MSSAERGTIKKEGLEGMMVQRSAETAQIATAEHSKAVVQARFLMAISRPRNFEDARLAILKTCERPTFAVKARYKKKQNGAKSCGRENCPQKKREYNGDEYCDCICGLSIHAADEFAKYYRNIQTEQATLYDDDEQRIIGIAATDLEYNITKSVSITIKKTIERTKEKLNGRTALSWRENSKGNPVAVVQATDDELIQKEGALCAKARRNLLLQLIPADLLEEAEEMAFKTVVNGIAEDPDAAKKKIIASFSRLAVKPSELEKYLGHSLDGISVAEIADLQCVYSAIANKETKWSDFLKASESGNEEELSHLNSIKKKMREKIDALQKKEKPNLATDFAKAHAKLSLLYDERGEEIDAKLEQALGRALMDIDKDTGDPEVMREVIRIAAEF